MLEEKTYISITKDKGTPNEEIIDIRTNGHLLFYMIGDKIKTLGDIELSALAPILARVLADKLTKGM